MRYTADFNQGRHPKPRLDNIHTTLVIQLAQHLHLREILRGERRFATGVELVSIRSTMSDQQTIQVRKFGEAFVFSFL